MWESASPVLDYPQQQAKVASEECLRIESDLVKYLNKIIALCEEYGVTLIFYRAPYRSTANELRKANWLEQHLYEKNILYYDLEKELEYNYETDFHDYEHLSLAGATKATWFLAPCVVNAVNEHNQACG